MCCVHDRVIVDNMCEFQHSSSRASCTFSMQDSRVKRGNNIGHKTQQACLRTDSGLYNSTFPSLVNCILTFPYCPDKASVLSVSSPRVIGLLKVLRQSPTWRQSAHKIPIDCCSCFAPCFAPCSCFAPCCLDPFIVRSASKLLFTITDNCLFLFLSMFLFLFLFLFLGMYLNTARASVQISSPLDVHRSKPLYVHTWSVYVRTTSAGIHGL